MFRSITISVLGLAAIVTLNAGQIYIGTGANGINGLTGATGSFAATVTGTNVSQGKYTGSLFVGVVGPTSTNNPTVVGANVAPPNGNQAGGEVVAGGGTTFALIDNATLGFTGNLAASNDWAGANSFNAAMSSSFTIPINIFGVDSIDTMLNDEWGINNFSNTSVTFKFADSSHALTVPDLTFNLINGLEIRSATQCTGTGGAGSSTFTDGGGAGGTGSCTNYTSSLNTTNRYGISGNTIAAGGAPSVAAYNVWTGAYTGNTTVFGGTGSTYANTAGNLHLDGQNFNFGGAYTSDYLVSVVLNNNTTVADPSRLVLSAISVNTPEPSSALLILAGLGSLGLYRRRRRA